MTRRCSHCSNNGHNSRTCPSKGGGGGGGGVKIFGVRLTDGSIIKKSASMGNLTLSSLHNHHHCSSPRAAVSSANPSSPCCEPPHEPEGYLSDDLAHASTFAGRRGGERKKGVPWTEDEHRLFLVGLQKLGKGDWRGIARNFVVTRTPTQVASHAQKYFIRQSNATRRKRRSSLFDMAPDMSSDPPSMPEEQVLLPPSENSQPCNGKSQPSLNLSLKSEFDPMETTSQDNVEEPNETTMGSKGLIQTAPGFFPAYLPTPFSIWPSLEVNGGETSPSPHHHRHQVLKPIPVFPREPVNVDELVGMSHLSIVEAQVFDREPSPLSLKLLGEPSRQSAFHANAPVNGSNLKSGKNSAIQAV